MPEYDLDKVKGKVQTTMKVVILPFKTIVVKGQVQLNMHSVHINVLIEPTLGYSQHIATFQTCRVLQLGSGKINISLQNMNTKEIEVDKKIAVSEIMTANAIPGMLALNPKKMLKLIKR